MRHLKLTVRKIDVANRVKIPKEILMDLGINKGDSLEIFHDNNNNIILKKFNSN